MWAYRVTADRPPYCSSSRPQAQPTATWTRGVGPANMRASPCTPAGTMQNLTTVPCWVVRSGAGRLWEARLRAHALASRSSQWLGPAVGGCELAATLLWKTDPHRSYFSRGRQGGARPGSKPRFRASNCCNARVFANESRGLSSLEKGGLTMHLQWPTAVGLYETRRAEVSDRVWLCMQLQSEAPVHATPCVRVDR